MAFPIASRRSVSFPRGTRVAYVTWDVSFHNNVAVLVFFNSSIVSHSMSEKTLFVAHGKQCKHCMTSKS